MRSVAAGDREGKHITLDSGESSDEGVRADARELMHGAGAADHRVISDLNMTAKQHIIGKDRAFAEVAIMSDVAAGQQNAMISDARFIALTAAARVNRDAFANDAIGTDDEPSALAARLQILRRRAYRCEGKDFGARSDARLAHDDDVRSKFDPVAKLRARPDMAEGSNDDIGAKTSARLDNGGWVRARGHAARPWLNGGNAIRSCKGPARGVTPRPSR